MTMVWVYSFLAAIEAMVIKDIVAILAAIEAMSVKDIITLTIAAYGALLSTFVLVQSWRRNRRRVRIKARPTFLQYGDASFSSQMTEIEVVNHGSRPVVVNSPCFRLPSGKFLNFGDADGLRDFPKRLEDGEKASIRLTNQKIAKSLSAAGLTGKAIYVRPTCTDVTGNRYVGPKWKADMVA
jgi:hypothetical protein